MSGEHQAWRRAVWLTVGMLGALLVVMGGSLAVTRSLADSSQKIVRELDYGRTINLALSSLRDAERGQRGYLPTGDDRYLEPFNNSADKVDQAFGDMAEVAIPRALDTAARYAPLAHQKVEELRATVTLFKAGQRDEALELVRSDLGRRLMEEISPALERERVWVRQLNINNAANDSRYAQLQTIGLVAGLVLIATFIFTWILQSRRQLAEVDQARGEAQSALSALVAENAGREAAEAKVRQMQKMESIGQLTGGIAHDFNNMLAVVSGAIELAKRRLDNNPAKALEYLDNALESVKSAATLTSRLLAFSRSQPLAPKAIEANKLVSNMSELLQRSLGEQVTIETVLGGGLWKCFADPAELENAILNLAVNARDAMPEGGNLTLETANAHLDDAYARTRAEVEPGQYISISVTDTGSGMTPEVIERAFDPFFTTKDVGKGTGLGLSQVFGYAKQSGGHVAIYSEMGEGTTVRLYLPRFIGADAENVDSVIHTEDMPLGQPHETILIVEDEQRVRHFAADVLNELGYATLSAGSPAEALRLIEENPTICLLFTDIVMPELNGRKLADLARQKRPDLKVLFTTGYTRNAVVHNGMLDVGVAFLAKLYSIADLARKIREVIDGGGINRPG